MRILLRDIQSKQFYQHRGQWTDDREAALDFQYAGSRPECVEDVDLIGAELVVVPDEAEPAVNS
jgi:hypothetical protein